MLETEASVSVLVVDDHALLRAGVVSLIEKNPDMILVGEAVNGRDGVEMFRRCQPQITLMDLQMPQMNGVEAIGEIRRLSPRARIIALTAYPGDHLAQRALQAGAQAYLLKGCLQGELVEAIHSVMRGQRRIDPQVVLQMARHSKDDALSVREIEILKLISCGVPSKGIASELSISQNTVNSHVKNIVSKLGALDRTHAAMIGLERGIIGFWSRVGSTLRTRPAQA